MRPPLTFVLRKPRFPILVDAGEKLLCCTSPKQCAKLDSPLNQGLKESRGMLPEYDGVAEVWFESEHALIEGMSSPGGQKLGAALLEDEGNFVDHSKSSAFIVEEHEL